MTTTQTETVKIGTKLKNGATVIAIGREVRGMRPVLAMQNGHEPYVTWMLTPDGDCFWGHYFTGIGRAAADFEERSEP